LEGRKFGDRRIFVNLIEMSGDDLSVGTRTDADDDIDFHQNVYDFLLKKELPQNVASLNQPSTVYFLNEAANYCVSFVIKMSNMFTSS